MIFRLVLIWFISLVGLAPSFCSVPDTLGVEDGMNNLCELLPTAKKNNDDEKLNMTVFYESLCGDCIDFFDEQFAKNWLPFYDNLNISLVPYGKATQTRDKTGHWNFHCQHGKDECYFNRIQACAISRLIKDRPKQLFAFISCYMALEDKEKFGLKCARLINYDFGKFEKCARSQEGFDLLAMYGDITHDFRPKLRWIPTIVFNNKFNQTETELASSDLRSLLCQKLENLPKACT